MRIYIRAAVTAHARHSIERGLSLMRKMIFAVIPLLVFAVLASLAVQAQEEEEKAPDAKEIFDSMVKKTATLDSYSVIFEYEEPETEKREKTWRKCDFWYMGGGDFLRFEVLDGQDKGSRVAYNAKRNEKKVYAKQGMMPIAIPLSVNDKRLEGFFESDWQSEVDDITGWAEDAEFTYLGEDVIMEHKAYKIQIIPSDKEAEYDRIILWIDEEDDVLLQYEYYNGDQLDSRKTWYDYKLDRKFNPKDFKP